MSHRRHLGLRVRRLLVLRPPGCAAGARHPGHTRAGRTASRRRRTGGCLGGVGGLNGVPVSAPVDFPCSNGWRPMAVPRPRPMAGKPATGFLPLRRRGSRAPAGRRVVCLRRRPRFRDDPGYRMRREAGRTFLVSSRATRQAVTRLGVREREGVGDPCCRPVARAGWQAPPAGCGGDRRSGRGSVAAHRPRRESDELEVNDRSGGPAARRQALSTAVRMPAAGLGSAASD